MRARASSAARPAVAAAVVVELLLQGDQRPRLADLAERMHRGKTDRQIGIDDPANQMVPGPGGAQPSERLGGREPHRAVGVRERVDQLVGHSVVDRRRHHHTQRVGGIASHRRPVVGKRANEVGEQCGRHRPWRGPIAGPPERVFGAGDALAWRRLDVDGDDRADGVAADVALGIPDQQAERLQGLRSPGGQRFQRRAPHLWLGAVHVLGEPRDRLGFLVRRGPRTAGDDDDAAPTTRAAAEPARPAAVELRDVSADQNRHVRNALMGSPTRLPVSLIPSRPVPGRTGAGLNFG